MSETANVHAGRAQQTGQTAKQEASATAVQVKEAAGEVAGTAAEQAAALAGEARQQAGAVTGDLRERVTEQAESQMQRGADALRQWADDLADLADHTKGDSPAKSLVTQAADRGRRTADYMDERGVKGLVHDVKDFARRRPGAFLGGAVLAGFAAGRLAKAGSRAGGGPSPSTRPLAPPPPVEQPFAPPVGQPLAPPPPSAQGEQRLPGDAVAPDPQGYREA
ncbi:hypothetical protein ACH4F6_00975 [Streptomyces sp. NPDC017936]|uniref:hypothetical protein n=1 Tax=Streptomyces sp. NPDC017936 TaxID=3365016 RepID=UPI00379D54ED